MLKVMRDNLKYLSWILWVVIVVFVLFVFVDFGRGVPGEGAAGGAAATVGHDKISYAEYRREYENLERQYQQAYGEAFTPEIAERMKLPLQAIDRLVSQRILLAEARRLDITVSDDEVRREILTLQGFKDADGNFVGEDVYARILAQNGYTAGTFEDAIRQQLTLQKMQSALSQTVFVSEQEVEQAYRDETERVKFRFVQLPAAAVAAPAPASDKELEAWYQAHQDRYKLPERRTVDYVLVDLNQLRATLDVPPADLKAYYDAHQDEFKREEEVHARHILVAVNETRTDAQALALAQDLSKQLQAGADFAKLAAEHSDDPSNKDRGGDLGWFARNTMVKEFADAAFNAQPGTMVGPVKTSYGYHLIQVLERRPAGVRPLPEVESEIRARLAGERAATAAAAKAKDIHTRAVAKSAKSLADLKAVAGADPAVSVDTAGPFGATDALPQFGRGGPFASTAFSLAKGQLSDPVQVPRGWAILLLEDVQAPRQQTLAEVRAQVQTEVERNARLEAAKAKLAAAKAAVAAGTQTLDALGAELGAPVRDSGEVGAQGLIPGMGIQTELAKQALATPQGQVGGPVVAGDSVVLFQVTERKDFDPAKYATEKAEIRNKLEGERMNRLLASLIQQRRKDLNVVYDQRIAQSEAPPPAGT